MKQTPNYRIVIIDGINGSGKTTSVKSLQQMLSDRGIDSEVFLANDVNHLLEPPDYREIPPVFDFIERWEALVNLTRSDQKVYLIDGYFYNNMATTYFTFNEAVENIKSHLLRIDRIFENISVLLVYLWPDNIKNHFDWLGKVRGEIWLEKNMKIILDEPYTQKSGLCGYESYLNFWDGAKALALDTLSSYKNLDTIDYCPDGHNWDTFLPVIFNKIIQ